MMTISDYRYLKEELNKNDLQASDTALGNLFILCDRYKIEFQIKRNLLLRKFDYSESIRGFAYPLVIGKKTETFLEDFLSEITENFEKKEIELCLFTEEQKKSFNEFLIKQNIPYSIEWKTNPADSDYIYLQNDLIFLPGKKLQKKRNHISQFNRHFEKSHFVYFDKNNFSQSLYNDFISVAENWITEQLVSANEKQLSDYSTEKKSLKNALDNIDVFDFSGGILYIDSKPVAITLASKISDEVLDIHFEKCLKTAANSGGYAVINNLFVKQCGSYRYINREEDLGIEGLRKAKLSYKPEIILAKYYGTLIKN